jgi:long-chain-fatty-acid--CoA ligase ACSBG
MTGAAPISTETLEYFGQLGIQINEVYGMSECTGATTFSSDVAHVWGSCGYAVPGCEVKCFKVNPDDVNDKKEVPACTSLENPSEEQQGEVCFRGRHIMMGYLANPDLGPEHMALIEKKTAESIDAEGWLHSGDKGCIDKRGMVKITGRYKEIIIGSGGENIAPVPIEDAIKKECQGLSNVMMVGDKRKFNVALVTLKAQGATGDLPGTDDLDGGALAVSKGTTTITGAMADTVWHKAITDAIAKVNKSLPPPSRIQRFSILPRDLSVFTDELTPTFKTKRSVVEKKYAASLDSMFDENADKTKTYFPYVPIV